VQLKNKKNATTLVLARFACELAPDMIPVSAYEAAKKCILDLVAAAAAGSRSPAARAVLDLSERLFSSGPSDVWFSGKTFNAPGAAYVNSTFASALDLDDGHRQAMGHPGASIIPAALAVAQETNAGGSELLAAIVIGYEVAIRVAAARDHAALDTLATGRWCAYGAAAAGGRLRQMNPDNLAEALAIAGVQAPCLSAAGYSQVMGNSAKEGIPWATLTGLSALWLADKGFTGPTDIFDHPDYYDHAKIISDLGKRFAIEGVYFKAYACCRWIHSAIDALCLIMAENGLNAEMIGRLEVCTFERALRLNNYPDPNSLEDVQYSIPFCMAVAAIEGKEGLLPLTSDLLSRKDIVSFAHRIQLYSDRKSNRLFPGMAPARVIAHTKKGVFEKWVESPKGDLSNPMDFMEIENKLRRLSRPYRSDSFPGKIRDAINSLEKSGIDALMVELKKR
jgi:2-methylcitrate dehydratase PrpD